MPASLTSVTAPDAQASFGTAVLENAIHWSLSPAAASFDGAHDPSDIPALVRLLLWTKIVQKLASDLWSGVSG